MRCSQCNKFVSLDPQDPVAEAEPEINEGTLTASYSFVRACAECGTELKSAQFDVECEIPDEIITAHSGDGHELRVEADEPEIEEGRDGKGSRAATLFTIRASFEVRCSCQKEGDDALHSGEWTDSIRAGDMDEVG